MPPVGRCTTNFSHSPGGRPRDVITPLHKIGGARLRTSVRVAKMAHSVGGGEGAGGDGGDGEGASGGGSKTTLSFTVLAMLLVPC